MLGSSAGDLEELRKKTKDIREDLKNKHLKALGWLYATQTAFVERSESPPKPKTADQIRRDEIIKQRDELDNEYDAKKDEGCSVETLEELDKKIEELDLQIKKIEERIYKGSLEHKYKQAKSLLTLREHESNQMQEFAYKLYHVNADANSADVVALKEEFKKLVGGSLLLSVEEETAAGAGGEPEDVGGIGLESVGAVGGGRDNSVGAGEGSEVTNAPPPEAAEPATVAFSGDLPRPVIDDH